MLWVVRPLHVPLHLIQIGALGQQIETGMTYICNIALEAIVVCTFLGVFMQVFLAAQIQSLAIGALRHVTHHVTDLTASQRRAHVFRTARPFVGQFATVVNTMHRTLGLEGAATGATPSLALRTARNKNTCESRVALCIERQKCRKENLNKFGPRPSD